jgi:transcriptional regulator with XRE-family HTH domain
MSGVPDSEAQKAMGARLAALREALGLTQEDMAAQMGVVTTALSAWESGRNQIDIVKLARSADRWGFTTDWVARGDLSGLRRNLADKVAAIIKNGPSPRRGRPPVRREAPIQPLASQPVDRMNKQAWNDLWDVMDDAERDEALRMLDIQGRGRARA